MMPKKLRRSDIQYLDDGTYKILAIKVHDREEAADLREQIITDQKISYLVRKNMHKIQKNLYNYGGHEELSDKLEKLVKEYDS